MKSCSSGMSDAEDVRPFKRVKICEENSDSGMSYEKLLRRSPRINSVIVAENGKINSTKTHSPKKNSGKQRSSEKASSGKKQRKHEGNCSLIGDPVSNDEAQERWHWRYEMKVPDFALNFERGKSRRPYGRLWWDETLSTVVTYPDIHSQAVIHPEQDRVLTVRECARLQGFPDYYRFRGTVKQRYRQIGNAVAVPVGRALGYALKNEVTLTPKFSHSTNLQLAKSLFEKTE